MEMIITEGMFSSLLNYKMIIGLLLFCFGVIIVTAISKHCRIRNSQYYRKLLTDLYVAGIIRKFAKEDGINFAEEEDNFKRWLKKEKIKDYDLDSTIEEGLKEKISEKNQGKLKTGEPKTEKPKK